ncbi:MazG nucleotide pyrophosphohydrolase domain-containing protein [Robertmurraya kyonggiensis]|uniref:NTP pyrophosphohydrolase MazG-like domain-containing protein n=1 Tax=Robertmurraya kyonggiensis TaxID=1037680 RepID=A0A4U1D9U8_9BACI|nr:MazG nucleotide pyrophosphohydrolase domain-containing protein [Robertmurraya kyonggiensis]TKC19214.1 hypothetical protein FA727_06640 [Robertmurraya kyonggiensis]
MRELQKFTASYQRELDWQISDEDYQQTKESLLHNYMLLTTEVAEVAEEFRKAFNMVYKESVNGADPDVAFAEAKSLIQKDVGKELADCIAYICKFANFFEIDLEETFYEKMDEVKNRSNKNRKLPTY